MPLTGTRNFSPGEISAVSSQPIPPGVADDLQATADAMQSWRDAVGAPMILTSAYRSYLHNLVTEGASSTSQHPKGEALDCQIPDLDFSTVAARTLAAVADGTLTGFRQLILYPTNPPHYHFGRGAPGQVGAVEVEIAPYLYRQVATIADVHAAVTVHTGVVDVGLLLAIAAGGALILLAMRMSST